MFKFHKRTVYLKDSETMIYSYYQEALLGTLSHHFTFLVQINHHNQLSVRKVEYWVAVLQNDLCLSIKLYF